VLAADRKRMKRIRDVILVSGKTRNTKSLTSAISGGKSLVTLSRLEAAFSLSWSCPSLALTVLVPSQHIICPSFHLTRWLQASAANIEADMFGLIETVSG